MPHQIHFIPALSFNNQSIALDQLWDQAKNLSGYKLSQPLLLGTLGDIKDELVKLFEIDSSSLTPTSILSSLPQSIQTELKDLENEIENTNLTLNDLQVNLETQVKKLVLSGTTSPGDPIKILGLTVSGFSLSISSGPSGSVKSITENRGEVTVTIADVASELFTKINTIKSYTLKPVENTSSAGVAVTYKSADIANNQITFTVGSTPLPADLKADALVELTTTQ